MFEAIRSFSAERAAGILALAALSLHHGPPPTQREIVPAQREVVRKVLSTARSALDLEPNDWSDEAIQKLEILLDEETDRILANETDKVQPQLTDDSLNLPSDVYEIQGDGAIKNVFGAAWPAEFALAKMTVRQPDREQAFGAEPEPGSPPMVNIYAKFFEHRKYPARGFWLLVVATRKDAKLTTTVVLRAYPSLVDISSSESLLEATSRLANFYGSSIRVSDGRTGSFFASLPGDHSSLGNRSYEVKRTGKDVILFIATLLKRASGDVSTFIMALNFTKYYASISERRGWDINEMQQLTAHGHSLDLDFSRSV